MSQHPKIAELRAAAPVILPSLLLCDFGDLKGEIARLEEAGVRALHLDVMDGHFVPNLTYGLPIVEACRRLSPRPLDVHLMISEPERYVEQFVASGADIVTIHAEAMTDPRPVLERIKQLGAAAALAINPPTPVSQIVPYLDLCDMVLVMSVMPGFGGQSFDPIALDKLRELRSLTGSKFLLEIDGGVNAETIASCSAAGADLFVAGSAIFCASSYGERISTLSRLAREASPPLTRT